MKKRFKHEAPRLSQMLQQYMCGGSYKKGCGGKIKKMPDGGRIKEQVKQMSDAELQTYIQQQEALQQQYQAELEAIQETPEQARKRRLLTILNKEVSQPGLAAMSRESTAVNAPMFKKGGIYIKPSKRGTFTAAAKKRNMGVQEFAGKVLANKDKYSSAMVKKANFARNFGGKKQMGGYVEGQEYDITEQQADLLRKLGYEFEIL